MSLLIAPLGTAPGHSVAMSQESLLRQDLINHLKTLRKDWFDLDKLSAQVIEGVIHLEKHQISWTEVAALSDRHIIDRDCMAIIITGKTDEDMLHHRAIREGLKITSVDVSESRLGLPIVPSNEYNPVLRYLWIQVAVFMMRREDKEHISALRDRLPPSPLLA